ncbi:MAG: dTMP kinase [Thermodesulfovibrionales bacterium]|nr:dTMP kinase [Thermodesulfovibrionales bacterium]
MKKRKTTPLNPPLKRGNKFISLEGIEGTGKSTQARLLSEHLSKKGYKTALTQEPGGTLISSQIRKVLLSTKHHKMDYMTELLLYNAARVQHIKEKILPALREGRVVITDRFSDSTVAYQGYGRGISLKLIDSLDKAATGRMRPDITILLELDVKTGLMRNKHINKVDRLELEDIKFHEKVRKGFLKLAAKEPGRIKIVKASKGIDEVHREIVKIVEKGLR